VKPPFTALQTQQNGPDYLRVVLRLGGAAAGFEPRDMIALSNPFAALAQFSQGRAFPAPDEPVARTFWDSDSCEPRLQGRDAIEVNYFVFGRH
jgi:hypothetical protein